MLEREHFIACKNLVKFLNDYASVIELQLDGVHNTIDDAVGNIMESITEMSSSTEDSKSSADDLLEKTYLAPSAETKELVDSVQGSVDDIMAEALGETVATPGPSTEGKDDELRRLSGLFSKHMESMSTMDDAVKDVMLEVIGALSNGDVISQRLEHLSRSVNALKLALSYMLVDVNNRFTLEGVQRLSKDLNEYIVRQYSSKQERALHEKYMGKIAS